MGTELSEEQLVELQEAFGKFVKDKDKEGGTAGQIPCPDLPELMEEIGMPMLDEAQYDDWVTHMDTDSTGFVTFDMFAGYISTQMKLSTNGLCYVFPFFVMLSPFAFMSHSFSSHDQ